MRRKGRMTILTDGNGRPFEHPDPATMPKIAYIRAVHAYNDAVTDCANRAFAKGFRLAIKAGKDA